MEYAVATSGLTKVYGRKFFRTTPGILDLDLEVRRGEVFGYLGPNGSGKTTTLRCLVDLLRPTRGRARVLGCDPRRDGLALRRRLGYLPGDLSLEQHLTGRQLLIWFENLRRIPCPDVDVLAERLELDLSKPVRTLSKGNRQKLGLVQALMHRPELVLLDEPTTGLDPIVREEFCNLVREGRDAGQTFLLSSHAMDEVQALADRVGILRRGRLVHVSSIEGLRGRARTRYEILFRRAPHADDFRDVPGLRSAVVEGRQGRFELDGSSEALLNVATRFGVVCLESGAPDLGRIFLSYYQSPDGGGRSAESHAA